VFNHYFWSSYFRREFVPQLRAIVEVLEMRTLPAFSGIEQEAEKVSEEAWDAFMSAPGTGDEDPSDFAEAAEEAGVSHYMLLNGIRQGMVNLFAAPLYHAFEQQVMLFLRREVLDLREENNPKLFQLPEFQRRLKARGLDVTSFHCWGKLDELRLVANTVKHAEGESARKLHALRADMFEHPSIAGKTFGHPAPQGFSATRRRGLVRLSGGCARVPRCSGYILGGTWRCNGTCLTNAFSRRSKSLARLTLGVRRAQGAP
jgi:hypothetical protein